MKVALFLLLALTVCCFTAGLTGVAFTQTKSEDCDNKVDDDGDKLVDCADPDCKCEPPKPSPSPSPLPSPPPTDGKPCSPGYWKNHQSHFNQVCQAAVDLNTSDTFNSCADLMTALTCRGSDASCKRHEAAALLNTAAGGCFED